MSELNITREALSKTKKFEKIKDSYLWRDGGISVWVDFEHTVPYIRFCVLLGIGKGKLIPIPVRTLPQLRQLIRALFGDDALPRRELSSITDEELKNLFNIVSGDDYRPDGIIESKRMESCWNVGILDYIIVSISDLGLVSYFPDDFYHDEVTPEAYNYLINVCDFRLPAFHEAMEKHSKQ